MQVIIDVPADKESAVLAILAGGAAPAAAKAAPKAAPAAPVEEDLLGGSTGATMDDAVELATKFVSEGKAADVKAALATVGAARVGEISDENLQAFVDALSA